LCDYHTTFPSPKNFNKDDRLFKDLTQYKNSRWNYCSCLTSLHIQQDDIQWYYCCQII